VLVRLAQLTHTPPCVVSHGAHQTRGVWVDTGENVVYNSGLLILPGCPRGDNS